MVFVTLLFKNFIPAMVLTVVGTISNVLVLNWDKSYLSPWAIPADISFVAISKGSTMNIMYPINFICIYIVVFSVCSVIHFNLADQSV
jgi:bacitracin transport system permease protein